jgi:hypothetical protein
MVLKDMKAYKQLNPRQQRRVRGMMSYMRK